MNTTPDPSSNLIFGKVNSFFGANAGRANTTGANNSFFGVQAGLSNTTGQSNSFFGRSAGQSNTEGIDNAFFGRNSGFSNTTGVNNSFFGSFAGSSNTQGVENAFFGRSAGFSNTTGDFNSFVGKESGRNNTTGDLNSFIGSSAGDTNTTGTQNTTVGADSDVGSDNLTNATAIGARARVDQSHSLVLGSISGINGCTAAINCNSVNVGIGTTAPSASLHVARNTSSITTPVAILESAGTQIPLAFRSGATEAARIRADNVGNLIFATLNGTDKNIFFRAGDDASTDMFIQSSTGRVGIGTTAPDQLLTVNGGASKPGGGSWSVFSDERLKTLKESYSAGLEAIMKLQPIRYEYKPDNELGIRESGEQIGFAAQAVEQVIPEAVMRNGQGYLLINNDPIMWAMLNAIKELKAENDALRHRLDEVSKHNEEIKQQQAQIEKLKKIICLSHPDAEGCK